MSLVTAPDGTQTASSYDVEDQLVGATYGGASTLFSYDLGGEYPGDPGQQGR
ncbi:MAG: hypothetical protein MUE67_05370 [Anaerolineales bacterium]|nr:hypothetical protein [Anaerolineales bacterium]